MFKTGLILAGGLGKRLEPLTTKVPKPLLPIGEKPVIERIIEKMKAQGILNIFISVNYKKQMIKNYLKDGESLGVCIKYLEEKNFTGTAGSIALLPDDFDEDIMVSNGDLLTDVNICELFNFLDNGDDYYFVLTVIEKKYPIEFGVISFSDDNCLTDWMEKPTYKYHINAGVYGISRMAVGFIKENVERNSYIDMPDLWQLFLNNNMKIGVFKHNGKWSDIGKIDDYIKLNNTYEKN